MRLRKTILLILAVGVMAGLIALGISTRGSPAIPEPALPNPNGYDVLVTAGTNSAFFGDKIAEAPDKEQIAWAEKNQLVLEQLRRGLAMSCVTPPVLDSFKNPNRHLKETSLLSQAGRLFAAEGRRLEQSGRPAQAAESYLDAIRLASAVMHGASLLHGWAGLTSDALGAERLGPLKPRLRAEECRRVAGELNRLSHNFPPVEELLARDRELWNRNLPLMRKIGMKIRFWVHAPGQASNEFFFRESYNAHRQTRMKLAREFADRAIELETGSAK
ncbi:MAG TPA: hypothetical protein VHH73_07405 [Verrucomicrobiae bacterium]|nr:hypothetical protein [Verrucomicrobiae bacterium]